MTINENGTRKRISKHKVVVKQLMKLAMTGSPQALRIYFARHQEALERVALVAGPQPENLGTFGGFNNYTDEELLKMLNRFERLEQENAK